MIRSSPVSGSAAIALFVALAVWTMAPVLPDLHGAVPGTHLGDNVTGLWNVWWFTEAIAERRTPYQTDRLFAPFGTPLGLHTHATTHSLLAWLLTSVTSLVGAHNLAILAGLALNGICAWLLSYRLTRRILPSLTAGALFALSAHLQLRVLGHINLVHAWVLPLFALALLRLEERRGRIDAALLGVAAALVLYTDYYYFVYAALLCGVWAMVRTLAIEASIGVPRLRRVRRVLLGLMLAALALIAAILSTGGTGLELGPVRISARGVRNPLTALWVLAITWGLLRYSPSISARFNRYPGWQSFRLGVISVSVFLVAGAPLLLALVQVITRGNYTAPTVLWRSSPAGADALTLVLGHPLHIFTGGWTRATYHALDIDMMEQSLWLGLVLIALLLVTWRSVREAPGARLWAAVAIIFFVLSLGPFLRVGGFDTALPLPHAFLRYIPGIGNARIPGRAVVMVDLAIAVLGAMVLSRRALRSRTGYVVLAAMLILELFPGPTRVVRIPAADSIDQFLRRATDAGAVAELPTGLRDGFGEEGALDHRALVHQMWHGRPLVGGFVARLSPRIRAGYATDPTLAKLIDVSKASETDVQLPPDAAARVRDLGVAFLVVNRDRVSDARLSQQALESAGFDLVQKAGPRELYATR